MNILEKIKEELTEFQDGVLSKEEIDIVVLKTQLYLVKVKQLSRSTLERSLNKMGEPLYNSIIRDTQIQVRKILDGMGYGISYIS